MNEITTTFVPLMTFIPMLVIRGIEILALIYAIKALKIYIKKNES